MATKKVKTDNNGGWTNNRPSKLPNTGISKKTGTTTTKK
jgi:hypothetical protein